MSMSNEEINPWPRRRLERAALRAKGGDPLHVAYWRDLAAAYGAKIAITIPRAHPLYTGYQVEQERRETESSMHRNESGGKISFSVAPRAAAPTARRAWLEKVLASGRDAHELLLNHPDLISTVQDE